MNFSRFTIAKLMSISYQDFESMDMSKDITIKLVKLKLDSMLLEAVYLKTDLIKELVEDQLKISIESNLFCM